MQYDALLEQFGSDMNMYVRMVCDTVCTTVPKAVVHCMVRLVLGDLTQEGLPPGLGRA